MSVIYIAVIEKYLIRNKYIWYSVWIIKETIISTEKKNNHIFVFDLYQQ